MEKILFVSTRCDGKRAKFAKEYFDKIEELSAKFMMSTHGIGRWPSSRVPSSLRKYASSLEEKDIENVDHVVLMDEDPPYTRERKKFKEKIIHWKILDEGTWEDQKKQIKKKVVELVELVEKEIKIRYG